MSYVFPGLSNAYSANESDSLKVVATKLPTPATARAFGGVSIAAAGPGPAPPLATQESGLYIRSSMDDWYYRVHVIPASINFGNISGDTTREVIIWNGFFSSLPFQSFETEGGEGLVATGDISPPTPIGALREARYQITARGDGPIVIAGAAVWTIDGIEYTVPISGRRSTVFSVRPDWKLGRVIESYQWLNTLTTNRAGIEQVQRIRPIPRRALEYRLRLKEDASRLFDSAAFGWTGRAFGLPWWNEKTRTRATAAAGSTAVDVDTVGRSFAVGASALLYASATDYEVLDVAEVTETGLRFNNQLLRAWPAGSTVIPVMPAVPQATSDTTRALPQYLDGVARFTAIPADMVLNLPNTPAAATYRGVEMYTGETNWGAALQIGYTARRKEVDGLTGPLRIAPKINFPLTVRSFSWLLKSRSDARTLLAFFARRQGRRYPAWLPSGTEDFVATSGIDAGASTILVRRSEHGQLVRNHPARRDIVLILRDGRRLARRILAVENTESGSAVILESGFTTGIPLSLIKRISYLGLYRLASDEVVFSWATPEVAEVEVQFVLKRESL